MRLSIHAENDLTSLSKGAFSASITLVKSRISSIQSRTATVASPITAVTSSILIPHKLRSLDSILNTIFIGPPIMVNTISSEANKPSKVLLSLSASSLLSIKERENLCNPAIKSKSASPNDLALDSGNIFAQASPIALNTVTSDFPIFLNDSINNHRPSISSIFSINSSTGIPNFLATFSSSLRALI